ncbi:hypothetical protein BBW65_02055 [Helicobacter enhydrae]|uniref:Urease accessory protein UreH-like transmembrane domain-containing protein n=1 Tax=Helicobacter enhydrae TaxID=222136 RepID=A0A1B1U4J7_9HELI|nr:sulfite exporter TauE/SafE family protein [Helicobacter enhydrae]ANV97661.1 hypothetical protein BBW65_02055 [Helicobacter enhydrae]
MNPFDYWLIANIAFFSSISHCVGMCGGIALALNTKIAKNRQNAWLANLLYNFGRLTSYMLIGALCGGVGVVFEITPLIKGAVLMGIGSLIVLFAFLFIFAPKQIARLEPNLQNNYQSFFKRLYQSYKPSSYYLIGILNGFLPCGIVYFFALIALSSQGVFEGALVMFVFGMMTFVPMLLLGLISQFFLNLNAYRSFFLKLSALMMFVMGIYTFYKGMQTIILLDN